MAWLPPCPVALLRKPCISRAPVDRSSATHGPAPLIYSGRQGRLPPARQLPRKGGRDRERHAMYADVWTDGRTLLAVRRTHADNTGAAGRTRKGLACERNPLGPLSLRDPRLRSFVCSGAPPPASTRCWPTQQASRNKGTGTCILPVVLDHGPWGGTTSVPEGRGLVVGSRVRLSGSQAAAAAVVVLWRAVRSGLLLSRWVEGGGRRCERTVAGLGLQPP
jgi:hypothetical protein